MKHSELRHQPRHVNPRIQEKCQEISHTGNILEILGIGENTLSRILAEMGGILRFDEVKEIQKIRKVDISNSEDKNNDNSHNNENINKTDISNIKKFLIEEYEVNEKCLEIN